MQFAYYSFFKEIFSKDSKLHRGEAALHRRYLGHGSSSSIMLLIGRQSVLGLFIRYDLVTTCQSAPMISHSYPLNQKPAAGSSRVDSCCELNHSDLNGATILFLVLFADFFFAQIKENIQGNPCTHSPRCEF